MNDRWSGQKPARISGLAPMQIPPHDLDAERAVLGCMLLEGREGLPKVIEKLKASAFYTDAHRTLYEAMLRLFETGVPVDLITLSEELRRADQMELIGGPAALALLVEQASISAHLMSYVAIVRDMALFRDGISLGTSIVSEGYAAKDPKEFLEAVSGKVFTLLEGHADGSVTRVSKLLKPTFDNIERLYERKEHVTGIPTGFEKLDLELGGLQNTDFIIIAARPSMGKTAFALNIATNAALHARKKVLVLSLEMSSIQLVQRMLCSEARVDYQAVRTGYLTNTDWNRLSSAASRLNEADIFIDDTSGLTAVEVRAKARRTKLEHGLDLLIVDYLQLMSSPAGKGRSRQEDVSEISRSMKGLAKELGVPVVALSQLNRLVEQRSNRDHRPQLSDLRESGSLEQDTDVVMFIYRASRYREDLPPDQVKMAEIIIGKQRNGPIGTIELVFLPEYARFENPTHHPAPF
jgi:replicative DNA helicase